MLEGVNVECRLAGCWKMCTHTGRQAHTHTWACAPEAKEAPGEVGDGLEAVVDVQLRRHEDEAETDVSCFVVCALWCGVSSVGRAPEINGTTPFHAMHSNSISQSLDFIFPNAAKTHPKV